MIICLLLKEAHILEEIDLFSFLEWKEIKHEKIACPCLGVYACAHCTVCVST